MFFPPACPRHLVFGSASPLRQRGGSMSPRALAASVAACRDVLLMCRVLFPREDCHAAVLLSCSIAASWRSMNQQGRGSRTRTTTRTSTSTTLFTASCFLLPASCRLWLRPEAAMCLRGSSPHLLGVLCLLRFLCVRSCSALRVGCGQPHWATSLRCSVVPIPLPRISLLLVQPVEGQADYLVLPGH